MTYPDNFSFGKPFQLIIQPFSFAYFGNSNFRNSARASLRTVIKIGPESGEWQGLIATARVGDGGWVDLPQPIIVRAAEAFIAVPILIRLENDQDHDAVRQVNQFAFGQDGEAPIR